MAVFPGTHVLIEALGVGYEVYDSIIDDFMTPAIHLFREIRVYNEQGTILPGDVTVKQTYGNWNDTFDFIFIRNGSERYAPVSVDYLSGAFEPGVIDPRDNFTTTYCFDYFPAIILKGFLDRAVSIVNTAAFGGPTNYTISNMPPYWGGVVSDLACALAMEKLIADYTLWRGRLIFALPGNALEESGGDIVSSLETLKTNFEERAYKTLENEKFKVGNYLSVPTSMYYQAIRGVGRSRGYNYGKTRGWKPNRWA